MLAGGLAFGLAVARAGVLPRWAGGCLMAGVVLVVAASRLPDIAARRERLRQAGRLSELDLDAAGLGHVAHRSLASARWWCAARLTGASRGLARGKADAVGDTAQMLAGEPVAVAA